MNRAQMYRTLYYVDGFEIKAIRLEQEWIDFNMREKYRRFQDFIYDEIGRITNYKYQQPWISKKSVCITVCTSPYTFFYYNEMDVLKRLIDVDFDFRKLLFTNIEYDKLEGRQLNMLYEMYFRPQYSVVQWAKDILSRGLKSKIKEYQNLQNSSKDFSFELVSNLINQKIKDYEAN